MNYTSKIFSLMFILGLTVSGLTACNTIEGVGQDVELAGDAIEDAGEEGYND